MVSHETLIFKNKSIFNTLGYILMVTVNVLAVTLPINGKTTAQISAEYPNLFAPAGFTFLIWGLIYLSIGAFIIYQLWLAFSNKHPDALSQLMQKMKEWFLISAVANACWLFAWHYRLIPVSVVIMFMLLISLVIIQVNFRIGMTTATVAERWLIHFPFSLYLGWLAIAALANVTTLLVYAGWEGNLHTQIRWTIGMIGLGTLSSIAMVLLRNNIVYALVSVWAFYGILVKRKGADILEENAIVHSCIIAIGLIAITISWQFYRKQKS
ncbi:MAG: hypothetical protein J7623_21355 [Chitinophaga sp.]|uniref:hypothetical protein n=1 Tax=Chitinophaga sp. TaxID=1869181 RepID=UPI001B12A21E|nr:hypothetical protein [Chitinophaga sp.]MBO9731200.1 hypothetical protein [Chitinophaga sp.]